VGGKPVLYDYLKLNFKVKSVTLECNDTLDNDKDNKCDWNGCGPMPKDPDCTTPDDRECSKIGTECTKNENCCDGLNCNSGVCTLVSYKLTVFTSLDIWPVNPPVPSVQVTISGLPPKSTSDSGIAEFDLPAGNYNISVEDPTGTRTFSHFWDHNCSETHYSDGWYLDTNDNPYNFTMYSKDREITAFYKTLTQITDFDYSGTTISGKLLKENGDVISSYYHRCDVCKNTSECIESSWDRNVTLEYSTNSGMSWTRIATVKVATVPGDSSWSYSWTCVPGTNYRLKASYIPNSDPKDWSYAESNVEKDIACTGFCGDIFINPPEDCDPPNNIDSHNCSQTTSTCDYTNRRYGTRDSFGNCDISCNCIRDSWMWKPINDPVYCASCPDHCGDGTRNCGEKCEGVDLDSQTCESLGYARGTLSCKADCKFNTSRCIANKPPVASFIESKTIAQVGESISFDASASSDSDGSIVDYEWHFGDGGITTGVVVNHAYSVIGTYTVRLIVTDNNGATATAQATKTIKPVCGDSKIEYPEECDPPALSTAQCGGRECKANCICAPGCGLFEGIPVNAIASSEYSGSYKAINCIDNNVGTAWYSEGGGGPHWIYFDLDNIKCISRVSISLAGAKEDIPLIADIQVSNDTLSWTTVANNWNISRYWEWNNKSFTETAARYIRIYEKQFSRTPTAYSTCSEFRAYTNSPNCLGFHSELECPGAFCEWCPRCGGSLGRHINQWQEDKCVDIGTSCGYNCLRWWCNAECGDFHECCDTSGPCRATQYAKCENCACSCRNTPSPGYSLCSE
jgi:chitodextrinase